MGRKQERVSERKRMEDGAEQDELREVSVHISLVSVAENLHVWTPSVLPNWLKNNSFKDTYSIHSQHFLSQVTEKKNPP